MTKEAPLLLALDLTGTFAFGLNGALTAVRTARLDIVGVVTLGMIRPAVILGAVTGVGGGTLRDVRVRQVPSVLRSGLYAIPALIGAALTVATVRTGVYGIPAALAAAAVCLAVRMIGVRFGLNAPAPPGGRAENSGRTQDRDGS